MWIYNKSETNYQVISFYETEQSYDANVFRTL